MQIMALSQNYGLEDRRAPYVLIWATQHLRSNIKARRAKILYQRSETRRSSGP